jgi:hypothetical protein
MIEYKVFEKSEEGWWYVHGSPHDNLKDGMEDLLRKQEIYGKYGREFVLKYRTISDWVEI